MILLYAKISQTIFIFVTVANQSPTFLPQLWVPQQANCPVMACLGWPWAEYD